MNTEKCNIVLTNDLSAGVKRLINFDLAIATLDMIRVNILT